MVNANLLALLQERRLIRGTPGLVLYWLISNIHNRAIIRTIGDRAPVWYRFFRMKILTEFGIKSPDLADSVENQYPLHNRLFSQSDKFAISKAVSRPNTVKPWTNKIIVRHLWKRGVWYLDMYMAPFGLIFYSEV